jgi:hypothetical protein
MRIAWNRLALAPLLSVLLLLPAAPRPARARQGPPPPPPAARAEPALIGSCVGNCPPDAVRQEYAFYLAEAARAGRVAVRLCSADRFEVAVAKAHDNLQALAEELKRWPHVRQDEVALLLSPGCRPARAGRVTTEFWEVPRAAPLPAHVRNIPLTAASVEVVRGERPGARAREFARRLRESPEAYGVVLGQFYSRPAPLLRGRVLDAENLLRGHRGLRGRYAAALVPYGVTFDGQVEPTEPSFLIVRIPSADVGEGRASARPPSPNP